MIKKKIIISISVALTLLILFFLAINLFSENKRFKVYVVGKTSNMTVEFWAAVIDGLIEGAKANNIELTYKAPFSESDVDKQIQIIDEVIEIKPDGVIVVGSDYERIRESCDKLKKANIKFIMLDSDVDTIHKKSLVATDNYKMGKIVGAKVLENIKPSDKTLILSHMRKAKTSLDRERGIIEVLESRNIEYILVDCQGELEKSYKAVKNLLDENSENFDENIKFVAATNEYSTAGATKVFIELKSTQKHLDNIKIVAIDSSLDLLKNIESGLISATVVQKPFYMGYKGIEVMRKILENRKVEKIIDTGSVLIDKTNMFTKENQMILYPFN